MILCLGTTPAVQRVMIFRKLVLDAVNRAAETLDGAAGKSINVAKVLQALGEQPIAAGFLGGDRGDYLRALLEARGIELAFVNVATRTRQCVTMIDESAGTITELVEESGSIDAADFAKLVEIIRRRLRGARAVVMSGTIAPGGPSDLYLTCGQMAKEAGVIAVVDAQGPALIEALKAAPELVKPNRVELSATLGRPLEDEAAMMEAMQELCERGAQRVVVTAGKHPALAFDGRTFWRILSPRLRPVNPIGSGDALTAALVWRLARGEALEEACRWGMAAGAANALTLQAGEVNRADVERLVREVKVERIQRPDERQR
ncbi:MAG: 1-phosphofructokinase family hexose kinase [Verrucomicrobia bacterium]|nr:1-phosphofructokinase family hexose kinase [Verrucomicrobiota bacterium]